MGYTKDDTQVKQPVSSFYYCEIGKSDSLLSGRVGKG